MKIRLFVRVNGQVVNWDSLDYGQKKTISAELTERAMNAAGYIKNDDKTT